MTREDLEKLRRAHDRHDITYRCTGVLWALSDRYTGVSCSERSCAGPPYRKCEGAREDAGSQAIVVGRAAAMCATS